MVDKLDNIQEKKNQIFTDEHKNVLSKNVISHSNRWYSILFVFN